MSRPPRPRSAPEAASSTNPPAPPAAAAAPAVAPATEGTSLLKTIRQYVRDTVWGTFDDGRQIISYLSTINDLKSEVDLLTSYSSDTIYRLRYDTMQYDYISPSVTRLLGFTPEEIRQMNFRALVLETRLVADGMRAVESFEGLEATRKRGEVAKWQADYQMRTKDGRKIWVSDVSYPWYDRKGAIIGSVGSLRDITERITAEDDVKKELVRIANTDALTGLANRRVYFEQMENEIKRLKRSRGDLSMLLIDIDHFKRINDTHGHDVGDKILVAVTETIRSCLRETDTAARMGGEEFAVLLPETPAEGAFWVAERIRSAVAKYTLMVEQPGASSAVPVGCTVSIGISGMRFDEELDAAQLYKQADTRLYIAKHTGRNQVSADELVNLH